jgi:hypothetical protein
LYWVSTPIRRICELTQFESAKGDVAEVAGEGQSGFALMGRQHLQARARTPGKYYGKRIEFVRPPDHVGLLCNTGKNHAPIGGGNTYIPASTGRLPGTHCLSRRRGRPGLWASISRLFHEPHLGTVVSFSNGRPSTLWR